jgi:hypothetical protein
VLFVVLALTGRAVARRTNLSADRRRAQRRTVELAANRRSSCEPQRAERSHGEAAFRALS